MDVLNYIFENYIEEYEINRIEELSFLRKCASIILSHPINP